MISTFRVAAVFISVGMSLIGGCVSTTMIRSTPSAKVYIDDQPVGNTPYSYSDTKIVGSATKITLKQEGYESIHTYIHRNQQVNVGALIGGIFVAFPLLWVMDYNSGYNYELEPVKTPAK